MATKAPTRDPDTLGQVRTAQLRSELGRLLTIRQEAIESSGAALLDMLRELIVVRRLTHSQVADAMGVTRNAVTFRVKPYRAEWTDAVEIGKPATWARPYAETSTDDLLAMVTAEHAGQKQGPTATPAVIALNERIRPYVSELMDRGRARSGSRWDRKTGLGDVAVNVGISRSTLARIMGWDT